MTSGFCSTRFFNGHFSMGIFWRRLSLYSVASVCLPSKGEVEEELPEQMLCSIRLDKLSLSKPQKLASAASFRTQDAE
jgi:hypothetical protein